MRIAVIIPDRGDRPEFLEHCKFMLSKQTLLPDEIIFANWGPLTDKCDITYRYRISYHALDGMDFDCVLFMENDDYYASNYIETMVSKWVENGSPDLFGIGYTYYYHIGINKYMLFHHPKRASMMNTLMKPDLDIFWCSDEYPYTDAWLWDRMNSKKTWFPVQPISIGIKHGIGMSGGNYHQTKLDRYDNDDQEKEFLKANVELDSFEFYEKMNQKAYKL